MQNRWSDLPATKVEVQCSHTRRRASRMAEYWLGESFTLAQRLADEAFGLPLRSAETALSARSV